MLKCENWNDIDKLFLEIEKNELYKQWRLILSILDCFEFNDEDEFISNDDFTRKIWNYLIEQRDELNKKMRENVLQLAKCEYNTNEYNKNKK